MGFAAWLDHILKGVMKLWGPYQVAENKWEKPGGYNRYKWS